MQKLGFHQLYFSANFKNKDILALRGPGFTSRAPTSLVLSMYKKFDIFRPKMGMAAQRTEGHLGLGHRQKFGRTLVEIKFQKTIRLNPLHNHWGGFSNPELMENVSGPECHEFSFSR